MKSMSAVSQTEGNVCLPSVSLYGFVFGRKATVGQEALKASRNTNFSSHVSYTNLLLFFTVFTVPNDV
jgi:hypothetical protein